MALVQQTFHSVLCERIGCGCRAAAHLYEHECPHADIIIRSGLAEQSGQLSYGANDLQRRRNLPPNRTESSRAESSCRAREADDPWAGHSTLIRRPRTIPTNDNVLSLIKSGEAPSQLRDLLPESIFDEFPFLDAQYHCLRRGVAWIRNVKVDLTRSGPVFLEGAVDVVEHNDFLLRLSQAEKHNQQANHYPNRDRGLYENVHLILPALT
jgi:hypothetical protein